MIHAHRDDRGLTLVETMAAITVFAIITVGVTPLIGSAIRGSGLSRSYTVGKDVAQQAMERARGLPYYVSFQAQNGKVDVLDLYLPCADTTLPAAKGCTGEGARSYNATNGTFTVTCAHTDSGPSCAVSLPAGFSVRYEAQFVGIDGATAEVLPTGNNYKRNPTAAEGALDTPPTSLVKLNVTALWSFRGTPQSFSLQSLIGDRKFGPVKLSGIAKISYGVQAITSYVHTQALSTRTGRLTAIAGSAESRVEVRLVSTAKQSVRAAEVTLLEVPDALHTDADPIADPLTGVVAEPAAPPASSPAPAPSPADPVTMTHPLLLPPKEVAQLNTTEGSGIAVDAADERPRASGGFSFEAETGVLGYLWVDSQNDPNPGLQLVNLHRDSARKLFSLTNSGGATMSGDTSIASTPLGAVHDVRSQTELDIELVRAFPVDFLPGAEAERHIVVIKDFTADLDCRATGLATSTATGSWSATFKMWRDPTNDNSRTDPITGESQIRATTVTIGSNHLGTGVTDGFSDLQAVLAAAPAGTGLPVAEGGPGPIAGGNPLIYDGTDPLGVDDLYLFKDVFKEGYLTDFTLRPATADVGLEGNLTTASIDSAMSIETVPPISEDSSFLSLAVGATNCEALDAR